MKGKTPVVFMKVNTAVVGDVAVPAPWSAPSRCRHVTALGRRAIGERAMWLADMLAGFGLIAFGGGLA